jgi:hypothetical protein
MHMDGSPFLEFEAHAPVEDLFDAALGQSVSFFHNQLSQEGLHGVVDVESQQDLVLAQLFIFGGWQSSLV